MRTVLGDVPADWIGPTLCHEHLAQKLAPVDSEPGCSSPEVAELADELRRAQRLGLSTVVDCTRPERGRDPAKLRAVAEASGVHVVAGTGHCPGDSLASGAQPVDADVLAEWMIRELDDGIESSGVRAGIIGEIGSDEHDLSGRELALFQAAALAQRRTGAPISTHTSLGALGPRQVELLVGYGANPRKILIGHMDSGSATLGPCIAIARRGSYVGIDRVGDDTLGTDDSRLSLVLALAERGLLDRVLLSHDITSRARLLANGGHGYGYLLEDFAPRLRERGLSDSDVELLLVHNPRRWLTW